MAQLRMLDTFCKAGGCSVGYAQAGFDVTGVDIEPQPRYPFRFIQADAIAYIREFGREYDVVHASPPCQRYSSGTVGRDRSGYPDLVGPTRQALLETGRAYVMENVPGAPLRRDLLLCGQMFGLPIIRHRIFESNAFLLSPPHPRHQGSMLDGSLIAVYGAKWLVGGQGGIKGRIPLWARRLPAQQAAMGIDWMTGEELEQAIPPAYTAYIGMQLRAALERAA